MYRFLISRKTLLLLAGIWIVSGLLLFVAGWLLGRHESAPTVDRERLAEILDATVPVRAAAARGEPKASTQRRDPTPWQRSGASPPPPASSTAPPPATASPPPATASPPPAIAPPPPATAPPPPPASSPSSAGASPPSVASQGSASSPSPSGTAASSSSSSGDPSSASPSSASPPSASPSPASASQPSEGGDFALQIGAFASKENAEAKVEQAAGEGLSPFIVPVIDGERTLFTVRVGRYASRRAALEAAEELRSSKGIAAVIRSAGPDAGG